MKKKKLKVGVFIVLFIILTGCKIGKIADSNKYSVTLTEEEENHPLSKYYYNHTKINQEQIASIQYHEPEDGLQFSNINTMLEPGYHTMENGFTRFNNGIGYVAVNTQFPNAKGKMLDWWFHWMGYETIRYKIWYPGLHAQALYKDNDPKTSHSISQEVLKNPEGKISYTIEAISEGDDLSDLEITFVNPAQFGLDISKLGKDQWAFCANVKSGKYVVAQMVHFVRDTENGAEMRSRFWFGNNIPWIARKIVIKDEPLYNMAYHCAAEYTQLASFLPVVYHTYALDQE